MTTSGSLQGRCACMCELEGLGVRGHVLLYVEDSNENLCDCNMDCNDATVREVTFRLDRGNIP
jgi:hypothetical protein